MSKMKAETLKKLVRQITREPVEEIDCDTCFDRLDSFVDKELDGKDAAQALPLVKRHLDNCEGCCEEYEALLLALESIEAQAKI